jgi:hypothetical protein
MSAIVDGLGLLFLDSSLILRQSCTYAILHLNLGQRITDPFRSAEIFHSIKYCLEHEHHI